MVSAFKFTISTTTKITDERLGMQEDMSIEEQNYKEKLRQIWTRREMRNVTLSESTL